MSVSLHILEVAHTDRSDDLRARAVVVVLCGEGILEPILKEREVIGSSRREAVHTALEVRLIAQSAIHKRVRRIAISVSVAQVEIESLMAV